MIKHLIAAIIILAAAPALAGSVTTYDLQSGKIGMYEVDDSSVYDVNNGKLNLYNMNRHNDTYTIYDLDKGNIKQYDFDRSTRDEEVIFFNHQKDNE